jgi:hypothetical protein
MLFNQEELKYKNLARYFCLCLRIVFNIKKLFNYMFWTNDGINTLIRFILEFSCRNTFIFSLFLLARYIKKSIIVFFPLYWKNERTNQTYWLNHSIYNVSNVYNNH